MGFAVNNAVINNGNKTVNKNRNEFFTNASLLQQRTTTKNIYKERLQRTRTSGTNQDDNRQRQQTTNQDDNRQRQQTTTTAASTMGTTFTIMMTTNDDDGDMQQQR